MYGVSTNITQNNMKKNTLFLFAFILFSLNGLKGQVVYTDINPDSTISASVSEQIKSYFIDLDNSGIYEFELRHFNPGPGNEDVELQRNFIGSQEVIINPDGHAKVLSKFDSINSNTLQWGYDGYGILNAPWYGGGDKYFGFRFKISGQWHYGWARVNIPSDHLSFTIKDYAYNQTPNIPIYAGQTSENGIINPLDLGKNVISIYPNPASGIYQLNLNFKPNCSYRIEIYNSAGKMIWSDNLYETEQLIDISSQPEGIYSVVLIVNEKIYTKKVIKQ
jgi:hypothetical protein